MSKSKKLPLYTRKELPKSTPTKSAAAPGAGPPPGTRSWLLYRLTFPDGLLLSKGRPDSYESPEALLRADTLKAALLACALPLYPELEPEERSRKWLGSFRLTSGFPFCAYGGDDEKKIPPHYEYFFPKPLTKLFELRDVLREDAGKPLKKLRWLGQSYFEKLLQADDQTTFERDHLLDGGALISDKIKATDKPKDHPAQVSALHQQPHVFVPRGGGLDAVPYHTESLHFGPGAGLWFAVKYDDPAVQVQVEAALRLLGDSGLGTDKNLGRGHFDWKSDELRLTVPDAATATHRLNLAPWCPDIATQELTDATLADASYALSKRGGYLAAPAQEELVRLRKKSIYMFDEGSVFPATGPEPTGALHDLAPAAAEGFHLDHPVWRDGRPLWLPIVPLAPDKTH